MPVSCNEDAATRPGLARVIGLGFQLADGRLVGPRDLLGDRAFDGARRRAIESLDAVPRTFATVPQAAARH
jgi:fructose 1,6-bisphosphate aldolase/phosphatase